MTHMSNVITFQWQSELYLTRFSANKGIVLTSISHLLDSVPKNKRRKNNNRRIDGRDRGRGDYFEEGSPVAGASSSRHQHRDVRYSDMAPK
jgi:hypothetical protein